jgi:hypothetical protein
MTDQALIEDWLTKNGGARRFERGASGMPDNIRFYLQERGYEMTFSGWKDGRKAIVRRHGTNGQRRMNFAQLVAFVDELRASEGLEPIMVKSPCP